MAVFDTSIEDFNLGNQIIMSSVYRVLNELFPDFYLYTLNPKERVGKLSKKIISDSKFIFFGGTNALMNRIYLSAEFRLRKRDNFGNKLILFGVGWWQYQSRSSSLDSFTYRRLLSNTFIHSVRDSYTLSRLVDLGFSNVLNTSCPTTWNLTRDVTDKIPNIKSDTVVFTLTDYNVDLSFYKDFLFFLNNSFKNIFFWPQGVGDFNILKNISGDLNRVKILPSNLNGYVNFCRNYEFDYIGTRLHAGILALEHSHRALIIAIDNRALEISRDINIPIVNKNILKIHDLVESDYKTNINIPTEAIDLWKSQFYNFSSDT